MYAFVHLLRRERGGGVPQRLQNCDVLPAYFQVHALVWVSGRNLSTFSVPRWWGNILWWVRVGKCPSAHSGCRYPSGVPPMPAPASHPIIPATLKIWRVTTTADVDNVTQGNGLRITKCFPSVVRSIPRHFDSCFRGVLPVQCASLIHQGPSVGLWGGGGAGTHHGTENIGHCATKPQNAPQTELINGFCNPLTFTRVPSSANCGT